MPARLHLLHRLVQLRAAVAQQALEDVAGQALAVDAHQHRLGLHRHLPLHLDADAAHAQGQVRLRIDHRRVGDQVEVAVRRRQLHDELALDQALALAAVLDEVLDGTHLEAVLAAELAQVRQAGHVAVGGHDLADDGRLLQPGQAGQVDAALGVAGADQHAALAGAQARNVALAAHEVVRRRPRRRWPPARCGRGRRPRCRW